VVSRKTRNLDFWTKFNDPRVNDLVEATEEYLTSSQQEIADLKAQIEELQIEIDAAMEAAAEQTNHRDASRYFDAKAKKLETRIKAKDMCIEDALEFLVIFHNENLRAMRGLKTDKIDVAIRNLSAAQDI
jgi:peptidoglycan hydrolase CwlO-like protein